MSTRLLLLALTGIATIGLASVAQGTPSPQTDMDRTKAAGWDCNPEVPIAGQYLHCAPPGKPSVADLVSRARHHRPEPFSSASSTSRTRASPGSSR